MANKFLPWSSITREERFFCSHLYHSILGKEKEFVKWLNESIKLNLNETADWEIGFEVCFYRDYIKANGKTIKDYNKKLNKSYPPKRTFDLCLFSANQIVIIEAKVQQGCSKKQMKDIDNDEKLVIDLVKSFDMPDIKVKTILLYSSKYSPREDFIKKYSHITWKDLNASPFKDRELFELADGHYGK
jgi:hypothetical protein